MGVFLRSQDWSHPVKTVIHLVYTTQHSNFVFENKRLTVLLTITLASSCQSFACFNFGCWFFGTTPCGLDVRKLVIWMKYYSSCISIYLRVTFGALPSARTKLGIWSNTSSPFPDRRTASMSASLYKVYFGLPRFFSHAVEAPQGQVVHASGLAPSQRRSIVECTLNSNRLYYPL